MYVHTIRNKPPGTGLYTTAKVNTGRVPSVSRHISYVVVVPLLLIVLGSKDVNVQIYFRQVCWEIPMLGLYIYAEAYSGGGQQV